MREDTVSDEFFYRVIAVYCAAQRDLPRNAFEGMKGRPPQSDREFGLCARPGTLPTVAAHGH